MYETISVLLLMQSYDDSQQFPRNFTDSSPTCMDKRLNLGQIGENGVEFVQTCASLMSFSYFIHICGTVYLSFLFYYFARLANDNCLVIIIFSITFAVKYKVE